jgi:hypothetical protein
MEYSKSGLADALPDTSAMPALASWRGCEHSNQSFPPSTKMRSKQLER